MKTLESETRDESQNTQIQHSDRRQQTQQQRRSYCPLFPLVLRCIPARVRRRIPKQFHTFKELTHLLLVFALVSCLALTIHALIRASDDGWRIEECIELCVIVPCLIYFGSTLDRYNDDTRKQIDEEKDQLIQELDKTLNEMSTHLDKCWTNLNKVTCMQFGQFTGDFIDYLERVKGHCSDIICSKPMVEQMQTFVKKWVTVYNESCIDPTNPLTSQPWTKKLTDELDACHSLNDLLDKSIDGIKNLPQFGYIAQEKSANAKYIETKRRSLNLQPSTDNWLICCSTSEESIGSLHRNMIAEAQDSPGDNEDAVESCFPYQLSFGCGIILILSCQHLSILIGFCFGLWMLTAKFFGCCYIKPMNPNNINLPLLIWFQFTTSITLWRFEEIDTHMRRKRELHNLRKSNEAAIDYRTDFMKFWDAATPLHDLWINRTLQRLMVYKEAHRKLEVMKGDPVANMMNANSCLGGFLTEDPDPLDSWLKPLALTDEQKERCNQRVNDCLRRIERLS